MVRLTARKPTATRSAPDARPRAVAPGLLVALGLLAALGALAALRPAMAVAQGEMDALYVSETSAYNYVQAKNAKAIVTMNRERSILFPKTPTITELVKLDKNQQWWLDYRNTLEGLGRILVVPPHTPHATLMLLRKVTKDILTNKKIVADFNKKKRYINYVPPDKAETMIEKILHSVTPAQKEAIHKVVLGS